MFHPTMSKTGRITFYPLIKFCEWMGEHHPVTLVKIRYFFRFHRFPDLKNPKDLNEKILYMKLFTDTSRWTELADKYRVRNYVKACGLEKYLIGFIGMWTNVDDIDFEALPNSFIFKANNGCGKNSNLIVKDKSTLDITMTKSQLQNWLSDRHVGSLAAEPHYKNMRSCIIAEQLLPEEKGKKSPIDYKIWCLNGKAYFIFTCRDRDSNGIEIMVYDRTWQPMPNVCVFDSTYRKDGLIPLPENFDTMLKVAEILSRPFPCVRIDLYNIQGKIYFGEMTFTSLGGMMAYFTPEFLLKMGKMVDLNYRNN